MHGAKLNYSYVDRRAWGFVISDILVYYVLLALFSGDGHIGSNFANKEIFTIHF